MNEQVFKSLESSMQMLGSGPHSQFVKLWEKVWKSDQK